MSPKPELDKRLDTIAKLLAKAESTKFPAEAEALTEQAERMMIRYGIDKAQVDMERGKRGEVREPIVERQVDYHGQTRYTHLDGASDVIHAFSLATCLQRRGRSMDTLYIIGAQTDVSQMIQLANSLMIQATAAQVAWWRTHTDKAWMTQGERRIERREYLISWYRGATVRARRIVAEARGESSAGTGAEIVLADRQARAQAAVGEMYPGIKHARAARLTRGSDEARRSGVKDGLTANVNGKAVDARRSISA